MIEQINNLSIYKNNHIKEKLKKKTENEQISKLKSTKRTAFTMKIKLKEKSSI